MEAETKKSEDIKPDVAQQTENTNVEQSNVEGTNGIILIHSVPPYLVKIISDCITLVIFSYNIVRCKPRWG